MAKRLRLVLGDKEHYSSFLKAMTVSKCQFASIDLSFFDSTPHEVLTLLNEQHKLRFLDIVHDFHCSESLER